MKRIKFKIFISKIVFFLLIMPPLVLGIHKQNGVIKYGNGTTSKIILVQNIVDEDLNRFNIDFQDSLKDGLKLPKNNEDSSVFDFALTQNYPNPFNPNTTISFSLDKASQVVLNVYDIHGREVANLINGNLKKGQHSIGFNALGNKSGVYIYRLKVNSTIVSKKMMYIK